MLIESILLSCNSAFDTSCHFVKLFRETLSPYIGSLSYFSLLTTVVYTQRGSKAFLSHEAEPLLSYRSQAACPLPAIHPVGRVFAYSSLLLPLFLIHQSPAVQ